MPTASVNLDLTQYVKINNSDNPLLIQALRDDVKIAFSNTKPAKSNSVFHTIGGDDPVLKLDNVMTDIWALPTTSNSSLIVTDDVPGPRAVPLAYDAWDRLKAVQDLSLFRGLFTDSVPSSKWKESINGVEQTVFTYATSSDGKLALVSNGTLNDKVNLSSFRHPQYQSNRGHLYSSSIFLPSKTEAGERSFGIFTDESGAMFRLRSGTLYAVRRTTTSGGGTVDTEEAITIPSTIDLEKGNTFDIQMQWRGVGGYEFFINQRLVHFMDLHGALTGLSIHNPALPVAYESINQGADVTVECGCVDVTSEGGADGGQDYGSISINSNTGSVAIAGYNIPVLVVRNKLSYNGLINTHDVEALAATAYGDQRCVFRIWKTRDASAITLNDQLWIDYRDGYLEYIRYALNIDGTALVGVPILFDTTKAELLFGTRVDQDQEFDKSLTFERKADIYHTPGDIFIFTMHRETGLAANVGSTYEFVEAI